MAAISPPVPLRAWALALLGVLAFALSVPMTRLATGSVEAPGLPPLVVGIGRAVVAGGLAAVYLLAVRAPWPSAAQWRWLLAMTVGVVFGWPLLLGWAVGRRSGRPRIPARSSCRRSSPSTPRRPLPTRRRPFCARSPQSSSSSNCSGNLGRRSPRTTPTWLARACSALSCRPGGRKITLGRPRRLSRRFDKF